MGGDWCVSKNLDLYEASQRAFDPSSAADDALRNFEQIYSELKSGKWQVFRPSRAAECWQPQKIFDTIKSEFSRFSAHPGDAALPHGLKFSWRGPVNLLNFPMSETGLHLESCLAKMREIKPKQDYPVMTVSKFLHFYNPGLFPIYDTEVVWKKVFGRFKNDFREFCERENISYDRATKEETATFLRDYMRWASSLLSVAHGNFMTVFVDWLDEQRNTE
jgi:hypothetical protein